MTTSSTVISFCHCLRLVLLAAIFSTAAGLSKKGLAQKNPDTHGFHDKTSGFDILTESHDKITKVVFIKTHETGSSTLTSMFHRFCDANGVGCFVHPRGVLAPTSTLGVQNLRFIRDSISAKAMPGFDVFASHSFFEPTLFEQMVPGSLKVSIFRDPRARTVASLGKRKTPAEIWQVLTDLQADIQPVEKSGAAKTCGVESMLMSTQVPMKYMDFLDFILLTEEYDLSLVLLRRKLHWTTRDIMYVPLKMQSRDDESVKAKEALDAYLAGESGTLSSTAADLVERCIGSEMEVQNEAKRRFKKQYSHLSHEERKSVDNELAEFQETLNNVQACCIENPDDEYCASLGVDNVAWTRNKQANMFLIAHSSCATLVKDTYGEGNRVAENASILSASFAELD